MLWAAAILVGLVHCFVGYKVRRRARGSWNLARPGRPAPPPDPAQVLRATAFTSGFVLGGGGAFYAAKAIFASASAVEYIAFICLLVVGILAGVGVILLLDVGIFLVGALLGVCVAMILNTAVLYRIAPVRRPFPRPHAPARPTARPLTPPLAEMGRMRTAEPG